MNDLIREQYKAIGEVNIPKNLAGVHMTEQEAFEKWCLDNGYSINGHEAAERSREAFQAGRAYEAERVKKLEAENAALKSQIDFLDEQLNGVNLLVRTLEDAFQRGRAFEAECAKALVEALEYYADGDNHFGEGGAGSLIAMAALHEYQGGSND